MGTTLTNRPTLMTAYGFDHVQLAMPPNQEAEARLFYGSLLGLIEIQKPANLTARGGVWFQCGAIQIHLGVEIDFRPAKKAHPAFLVADLTQLTDKLSRAGYKIKHDQETIAGYDRAFTEDPFGNRIELMQPSAGQPPNTSVE